MSREREETKVSDDSNSPTQSERKRSINSDDHSPKSATLKRPRLDIQNKEFKDRGKRMLGMIFNTLNQFKKDTSTKSEAVSFIFFFFNFIFIIIIRRVYNLKYIKFYIKFNIKEKRREEIENKLQERLKKEKKDIEEEVKQDDEIRRKKRIEEEKQRLNDLRKYCNKQNTFKSNFIKTKSTPHIYYLPAILNEETKKILDEQKKEALKKISLNTEPIELTSPLTPTSISGTVDDTKMKDSNIPEEKNEKEDSLSPSKKNFSDKEKIDESIEKSDTDSEEKSKMDVDDNEKSTDKTNEDDDQDSKIDDTMDEIQY